MDLGLAGCVDLGNALVHGSERDPGSGEHAVREPEQHSEGGAKCATNQTHQDHQALQVRGVEWEGGRQEPQEEKEKDVRDRRGIRVVTVQEGDRPQQAGEGFVRHNHEKSDHRSAPHAHGSPSSLLQRDRLLV